MKLPRYLQIALALSCALSLWSFFSVPESQPQEELTLLEVRPRTAPSLASHIQPTTAVAENPTNLFPFQGQKTELPPTTPSEAPPKMAFPSAPPLPFQVNGAWWYRQQRSLVLTDGKQQWIVCRQCQARDKIWLGTIINHDWQLVEVSADFLTFRWLPQRYEQRLTLGDMTSKPKF